MNSGTTAVAAQNAEITPSVMKSHRYCAASNVEVRSCSRSRRR